jgi:hypothetical protein
MAHRRAEGGQVEPMLGDLGAAPVSMSRNRVGETAIEIRLFHRLGEKVARKLFQLCEHYRVLI